MDMNRVRKTIAGLSALAVLVSGGFGVVPESAVDFGIVASAEEDYTEGTYKGLTYRNYGDHIEIIDCDETQEMVVIPEEIDDIPVTAIGDEAFKDCTKLTSIITVGCYDITSIGRGAFENCESLGFIVLPFEIDKISADMFKGCKYLNYIFLESTVKTIEADAFSGCENLEDIYYGGREESWGDVEIEDGNDAVKNAAVNFGYDQFSCISDTGGITLSSIPDKTEYLIGEELDLTGGNFHGSYYKVYLDGHEEEGDIFLTSLNEGIERGWISLDASEFDNTKPCTYTIYIRYDDYDDVESFEVTVKDGEASVPLGDLDGNDAINATDAAMLLSAAAASGAGGDSGLTEEQIKAADLNADGEFDAKDAAIILQYAAYAGAGGKDTIQDFVKSLL